MAEQLTEQKEKIYVWSKTERAGDIVTVDKVEGEFTLFTDGTQIFTNMIDEVLLEARDESQALNISQPFLTPDVVAEPTPVDDTPAKAKPTPSKNDKVDVMLEMLRKVSAKNTISMPLEINIPSHEVYELFRDQMDITKEDLNKQILALVLSQIDNLQEQLKPQAEEFINKYYYGKTKRRVSTTDEGATGSNRSSSNDAPDITY